jgi:elongation factor Ts
MTTIRNEDVKRLRTETGVGIMDCKRALIEANGDLTRAKQILREEGLELMAHKGREASEGRIESYIHHSARVGVLVEVSCNTDFAAKTADFVTFARDVAMHIAAASPRYIATEDVPPADLEREREIYLKQLEKEGKPAEIAAKAAEGRVEKFYEDACLVKQAFVKDPSVTIEELLADLRIKTGENVRVKRFVRYEVGEGEE